jgi:hypothetical protein
MNKSTEISCLLLSTYAARQTAKMPDAAALSLGMPMRLNLGRASCSGSDAKRCTQLAQIGNNGERRDETRPWVF